MAVGLPLKTTYADGDVYSASDVNDTNGTINLFQTSTLSQSAGKNYIINGGMDIWQRGTSFTSYTSHYYRADRWDTGCGTSGATTVSRQSTNDTTNLPQIQYCARIGRNSGSTDTNGIYMVQPIETVNSIPLAGKTVTVSFYARKGANFSGASNNLNVTLEWGTGTDQNPFSGYTGSTKPVNTTATLTTTWQRFTYTGSIGATATEVAFYPYYTPTGTAGAADYFEITGVQLELGSYATTFSRAGGTIQGELANCQRYYWRAGGQNAYQAFSQGIGAGSTQAVIYVQFPVSMRAVPGLIDYANQSVRDTSTFTAVTSITDAGSSSFAGLINANVASGLTQFRSYFLQANNNTGAYLGFGAEL